MFLDPSCQVVRSKDVKYVSNINAGRPHNGAPGLLMNKGYFERPPHPSQGEAA